MIFFEILIVSVTVLIWSLSPQSRAEALATLDLASLIDHQDNQSKGRELVWRQVGHPDAGQWEALGRDGFTYKVWFEPGVGWRVHKINAGITALEITALTECEAKSVAALDHG